MIRLWRLCQAVHQTTAFSGEGGRLYGGRWNRKGQRAVYTAATLSLAALEILVHTDTDLISSNFVAFAVDVSSEIAIERVTPSQLPPQWREEYPPASCQNLGSLWLDEFRSAVLAVPSAVIPEETNYILNPEHTDFAKLVVHSSQSFAFDRRLWR